MFCSLATSSFNDRLSSWWCGKNTMVRFCKDNNSGSCNGWDGEGAAGSGYNSHIGQNDQYSGMIMHPYNPLKQGAVTLFEDANCIGRSASFFGGTKVNDEKFYNTSDMEG